MSEEDIEKAMDRIMMENIFDGSEGSQTSEDKESPEKKQEKERRVRKQLVKQSKRKNQVEIRTKKKENQPSGTVPSNGSEQNPILISSNDNNRDVMETQRQQYNVGAQTPRKKTFLQSLIDDDEEDERCSKTPKTALQENSGSQNKEHEDVYVDEGYGAISHELYNVYEEADVPPEICEKAASMYKINDLDNLLDCDSHLMRVIFKEKTDDIMRTLKYTDTEGDLCSAEQYFSEVVGDFNITFKNPILNNLLGSGITSGDILEFYGRSGAGKSHIVQGLAIEAIQMGYEVIILDTERKISQERFTHLCRKSKVTVDDVKNLMIQRVKNQNRFIQALNFIRKKLKSRPTSTKGTLVVIDSISTIFRLDHAGQKNVTKRSEMFTNIVGELKEIVTGYPSVAVLYTNQVATTFQNNINKDKVTALGGEVLKHGTVNRIYVTRRSDGDENRFLILQNSNRKVMGGLVFRITEDMAIRVVREATRLEVQEMLGVSKKSLNEEEVDL